MPQTPAPRPPRPRRRPGALLGAPVVLAVKLGVGVGHGLFAVGAFVRRHHHHPVLAVIAAVIGLAATSGADTAAVAGEAPEPAPRWVAGARATVAELPDDDLAAFRGMAAGTTTTTVPAPVPAPTTIAPSPARLVHAAAAAAPAATAQPGSPLDHWPHRGPITGTYGEPRGSHHHAGIDIDGDTGDTIWTAGPGRVVATGYLAEYRGYGLVVLVDHGPIETLYTHLSAIHVEPGQILSSGAVVGAMGTTGNTTGSHLHFEVRQGSTPVDPKAYLPPR